MRPDPNIDLHHSADLARPYRKRPVLIEAVLVTEENQIHVAEWCHGTCVLHEHILIRTLEGTMQADLGDYVIRGIKGEFYPCKPDIFEASYEAMFEPEQFDGRDDLFGDVDAPVPDDPAHCFNCGNDLPCPTHIDGDEISGDEISLCPSCHCMTKRTADGRCGKCGALHIDGRADVSDA